MIAVPILFAICVLLIGILLLKEFGKKPPNFPPGPAKLPLWFGYWAILKENFFYPHIGLVKLTEKYKTKLLGLYLGPFPVVTTHDYDLIKEILWRDEFSGRAKNVIVENRGRGNYVGIFFTSGDAWKDQRWFSLRYMRDYGFGRRSTEMEQTAADEVRALINFFTNKPKPEDADICTQQGIVKMPDTLYAPAVNCIQHTLSSRHYDDYRELREIGRTATNFLKCIDTTGNSICITPWLRYIAPNYFGWTSSLRDSAGVLKFAKKIIEERKLVHQPDVVDNFIDVYLNEMNYLKKQNTIGETSFTEQQMIYTIADYTFPAPVGIGHTINIIFAYLVHQPEIQVKVQEEIDRVVGRSRLPTLDDRKDMPYTEALLREGLRKDPIVPLCITRRCTTDTYLGGYFIPKDTVILPNIWGTHNDPKIWKDPHVFEPARFLDEDGQLLKKDMTLGFGAGKRLCAGETFARNTMFIFVAGILQNFSIDVPAGHKKPDFSQYVNGITISLPEYYLQMIPRP